MSPKEDRELREAFVQAQERARRRAEEEEEDRGSSARSSPCCGVYVIESSQRFYCSACGDEL